jgi:Arm DNA-binding domain
VTITEPRRRRRRMLTDIMVGALPRKVKRYTVPDPEQGGMYVRVMPEGAHVFVAVARDPYGTQVWATIGKHDDVLPIEKARKQARDAIERIKKGLPAAAPVPTKPDTVHAVADEWVKRHVVANGQRSRAEVERVLRTRVLPLWAKRPFIDIRRSDVARLLEHIQDHHGPSAADHALAIVRGISSWYATHHAMRGRWTAPPLQSLRRLPPVHPDAVHSSLESNVGPLQSQPRHDGERGRRTGSGLSGSGRRALEIAIFGASRAAPAAGT